MSRTLAMETQDIASAGETGSVATQRNVEGQLLTIAAELVGELGGTHLTPTLDQSLERDLGISSLERVELLLRLERAFGVRLPDAVMADAIALRDLATAILGAEPRVAEQSPSRREPLGPGASAPSSARTLVDVLSWHTERTLDRVHIHLRLDDNETPVKYGELPAAAQQVRQRPARSGH